MLPAAPSISPMVVVGVWRTFDRNREKMGKIISLLISLKKLTRPRKNTLGLRPKICFGFITRQICFEKDGTSIIFNSTKINSEAESRFIVYSN